MTTKEQERKALAEIIKIVKGLGEDSYIATAFDGCFEIAAENIANDFACSMRDQRDRASSEALKERETRHALEAKLRAADTHIATLETELKREADDTAYWREHADAKQAEIDATRADVNSLNAENAALKDEIIHLKAKLYDLMTR